MGGNILMFGLEVLSFHEVRVADVESGFAEGASVKVFGLDGGNVSGISWDLGDSFLLVDSLELIVDFFGDVAVWGGRYPVYPGTTYDSL